jgi:mono/diheme cytochrome c family protein
VACLFGLALLCLIGCKPENKSKDQPPGGPPGNMPPMGGPAPPLPETGEHAAGKKVYNVNGCARCHTMGGGVEQPPGPPKDKGPGQPPAPPGPPGPPTKGPDLSKVASKQGRDVDWFIAYVSDPKKDNPESKMPPFKEKIKPEDLKALAEFLASLK